jgi:hypothetical protein
VNPVIISAMMTGARMSWVMCQVLVWWFGTNAAAKYWRFVVLYPKLVKGGTLLQSGDAFMVTSLVPRIGSQGVADTTSGSSHKGGSMMGGWWVWQTTGVGVRWRDILEMMVILGSPLGL